MKKLKKQLSNLLRIGKAFGYGFMIQCFVRRVVSFRWYEAYLYRYLTDYFEPVIARFRDNSNRTHKQEDRKKYIWSLWWQGEEHAPEIVKTCIASQRKMLVQEDVEYHVLTKDNWQNFIDLPDWMLKKVENGAITLTHFSDIIRAELIRKYGGIWIDATVYCAKKENLFDRENPFFTVKTREKSDCLTLRRWTGFFIGDECGSMLFDFMAEAFRYYWEREDQLIVYLLIDYLIAIAYEQFPQVRRKIDNIAVSNQDLWTMLRVMNAEFVEKDWTEKIARTSFFKLSYKEEFNGGPLKERTEPGKMTNWGYIKNS